MRLITFTATNLDGYAIGESQYFTECEAYIRINILRVAVDAYAPE